MLNIQDVSFRYPGAAQTTLNAVSLGLERGRVLGLLGPNGAGKTTLISHLVGLLPIQHGEIHINTLPLAQSRRECPMRIALAPQEYAFYPMLTVAENLSFFASACQFHGSRKVVRITACMALGQLERFASTRANQLSGGLKRRLNLAIAMLAEPELLLLDEPTVGVDPQSRAFLLDAVKALAQAGTTVIYTTHYIEEIEAIADDVAILDHGTILRHAPLASLLAEGGALLTLRVAAPLDAVKTMLQSFGSVQQGGDGEIELQLNPEASPAAVLQAIAAHGIELQMARYGSHDLERLFMHLTHRQLRDD
ncbi:ABC transporter ATP-binding protein [Uliginosibacterium gangwonense]|uniref:ABC transporter ATP-binding protein n=1 Tax=Uliginosibacterium gangwonense TaxID=392736 RepID=UPI00038029C3|nr:ABC transporter ATP-binding protein [Uliginosibacterium gangwonense]